MSKIQSIYKNEKVINPNQKKYCHVTNVNIKEEIDKIIKSKEPIYNKKVLITTKEKEYKTFIIGKYNEYIKIVSDEIIKYEDILTIKRIS